MDSVNLLAEKFFEAFYKREWVGEFLPHILELDISEAYQVQDLVAKMRVETGEEVVGFKVGCTSHAIRSQFGLKTPISGRIFAPHIYAEGKQLRRTDYVNCAIEPEMVLKIGMDLKGESLSDDHLIDAIEYVSPGIEIHNFKFWSSPPSSQELICSGGIHAGLVIGNKKVSPRKMSFQNEVFRVYKDETIITEAPASEIMGGPLHSLRWLVRFLTQREMSLKRGSFVIPGSPVELVPISIAPNEAVNFKRLSTTVNAV